MPNRRLMPDVVRNQTLSTLSPRATVTAAVGCMAERNIGAVIVTEDGSPRTRVMGIFTERDLLNRVLDAGRQPARTRLGEVMTPDPDTLEPDSTAQEALAFMQKRRYRHLPITRDGLLLGMVSIRDLFDVVTRQLKDEVNECESFVFGTGYSVNTAEPRVV